VTARVVVLGAGASGIGGKDESAQSLSDAERALLKARQTGGEAILQVGTFEATGEVRERNPVLSGPVDLLMNPPTA
jgi:hypothetical protein